LSRLRATFEAARADRYREPGGPWDQPSLDALLSNALDDVDDVVLVDGPVRASGRQLEARVARTAGGLSKCGVEPGDAVAWQLPNSAAAVVAYRACWRLGAVAVPIHHAFGAADVERVLGATQPRVVIDAEAIATIDGPPIVEQWTDGDALAAVLFTSGSSGAPKGVLHTQNTLAYKARTMPAVHALGPGDAVLMPAPLAHISGLLNGLTLPLATPFKSVLMARWNPHDALDLIEHEQVSFMVGPPTFFVAMLHAEGFSSQRVASLRLISSGGAGVSEAFVREASERFGCNVKRTYGSTEAPTVASSMPGDALAASRVHDGRAIGAVELRTARDGELLVRGPEVCVGYLDPLQNEAFTPDGWFRTGDIVTMDRAGWIAVVGRKKDVVIRGGENISTTEVEAVLEAHPAVHQAAAVGYPDELMGERVCAVVELAGTDGFDLDVCQEWFTERGVARYKTPERVVVVDALPLLATGKPDREALRALARTAAAAADDDDAAS
jgi:cyclohexanecarboxylate-CoA ligase